MATGIIVIALVIVGTFIYFWIESEYTEIWKRLIEAAIDVILFWAFVALFFAALFAVINYIAR